MHVEVPNSKPEWQVKVYPKPAVKCEQPANDARCWRACHNVLHYKNAYLGL